MFLGVTASVTNWDTEGTTCSIILEDNPLVDFVELPDNCQGLYYCNILSGVIRGALEMVSILPSMEILCLTYTVLYFEWLLYYLSLHECVFGFLPPLILSCALTNVVISNLNRGYTCLHWRIYCTTFDVLSHNYNDLNNASLVKLM